MHGQDVRLVRPTWSLQGHLVLEEPFEQLAVSVDVTQDDAYLRPPFRGRDPDVGELRPVLRFKT